jgi:TatD DNase family protein
MTFRYIDAHCHLQFADYDGDRAQVIARMEEQGIAGIVVGCDLASSEAAVALAKDHANLFAAIGVHPNHTEPYHDGRMRALMHEEKVVAIGECGLDYFRPTMLDGVERDRQIALFKKHIELSGESGKPLIIHARPSKGTMDAYEDVISLLQKAKRTYPALRGDVHFFVGGKDEADALVALDMTVSFTGVVTFAHQYDEVMRHVPLAHILVETDSPYVAPISRRGTRNDSLAIPEIVARIAAIRGEDVLVVEAQVRENIARLFGIHS